MRVASIPAMSPSPALAPSPDRHAAPVSAFAAATAAADGSAVHAVHGPADELQTDATQPSPAGESDAESIDGALSAVTVCQRYEI